MFNLLHKKILARIHQMKYNPETGHLYTQEPSSRYEHTASDNLLLTFQTLIF